MIRLRNNFLTKDKCQIGCNKMAAIVCAIMLVTLTDISIADDATTTRPSTDSKGEVVKTPDEEHPNDIDVDPGTGVRLKPKHKPFIYRKDVEHLITDKRSQEEDGLRAALLACAQSDEELKKYVAIVNNRWNKNSIETFGQWLIEDWDKEYGPSLRRPKTIFAVLVYVRNHENPYAFKDGNNIGVTVAEGKRVEELGKNIDAALAVYYGKLFGSESKWPANSRSELLYNIAATFEEHGSPEMIIEAIWKEMAECKKFRWDMLGVMSNCADQTTLDRLLKFKNSQQWAEDDLSRIDQGIKDVKWWLERAESISKKCLSNPETKIISDKETELMLNRVADAKAGRCPRMSIISNADAKISVEALSLTYTKLKNPLMPIMAEVDSDMAAVAGFVSGGEGKRELLILDGKPSVKTLDVHGKKWNALGPDGSGPTEYIMAGRAVAIVVNPTNKLDSLTLGQVQAIFRGDTNNWTTVGNTGLESTTGVSPVKEKAGGTPAAPIKINLFGLRSSDVATAVFEKECLPRSKWKSVTSKKDTAEVLKAVSLDPLAIGFVDLGAIQAGGPASPGGSAVASQNAKVLAIQVGTGDAVQLVKPTPENIKSAMYPLSQRLYLYVHPKASETAKDFAAFLATCGGSEAGPYVDTVKAVMDTYAKHGLMPLGDAALERQAKDALAEAEKKADGKQL